MGYGNHDLIFYYNLKIIETSIYNKLNLLLFLGEEIFDSITDRVGKFCKPPSVGLCNEQLAFGNWQLA
jgi:hypothetical protein